MTARMLILPLKSDQGTIDRALGCMVAEGPIGLTPRRFQIAETRVVSLRDGQTRRELADPKVTGFAEPTIAFKPQEKPQPRPTGKPNLRLVSSDTWT